MKIKTSPVRIWSADFVEFESLVTLITCRFNLNTNSSGNEIYIELSECLTTNACSVVQGERCRDSKLQLLRISIHCCALKVLSVVRVLQRYLVP